MGTVSLAQVDPRVASFLEKPRQMLINGKWVDAISGKTFPTYDPSTGEVLATVAEGDTADIDLAVKAARKAFEGKWRKMTPSERGKLIWKLGDLIDAHVEEFAYLESLDNGKPLTIARAADVPLAAGIWTRDISKAHRMADQIAAGTVWINCYNIFDAALPFGGYKQSGWGREMGHEVLNNYTQTKAVCARI